MPQQIQSNASLSIVEQLEGNRFLRPQSTPAPADDLKSLMTAALNSPIHHPALNESVFPGDTVAIAFQSNLPKPDQVLNTLLDYLFACNVEPTDVTVVLPGTLAEDFGVSADQYQAATADDDEQAPEGPPVFQLSRDYHAIQCQVHDPDNAAGLSYLVANEAAEPIHVNRVLVDADVVIPVGCASGSAGDEQTDCLYPTYGSQSALDRFALGKRSLLDRHAEIELANDTLGAFFAIQLVVGPGETIQEVQCGVRAEARTLAQTQSNTLWQVPVSEPGDSAVVSIDSRPGQQTWDDFSQALINASRLTEPDAPIVIWSDISVSPDRNTRKACLSRFEETISSKLSKTLQHVASILKDRPVYFRSGLSRSVVEEIGLSVIETVAEIEQLSGSLNRCIVLRDGHKCRIA